MQALAEAARKAGLEVPNTMARSKSSKIFPSVRRQVNANVANLKDQVVSINRVTKVVKGGKNLTFSALVVVGDQNGHAGFGMEQARAKSPWRSAKPSSKPRRTW